jgi:hypothetical protein
MGDLIPEQVRTYRGGAYHFDWGRLALGVGSVVLSGILSVAAEFGPAIMIVVPFAMYGLYLVYRGLRPALVWLWMRDLAFRVAPGGAAPGDEVRAELSFRTLLPVRVVDVEFQLRAFEMGEIDLMQPARNPGNDQKNRYNSSCVVERRAPATQHLPPRYGMGEDVTLHADLEIPSDGPVSEVREVPKSDRNVRERTFWEVAVTVTLQNAPDWERRRIIQVTDT